MVDESDSEGGKFDPDSLYDQFPSGETDGFGTDQGYNTIIQLNDPTLFTEEAQSNPVIKEFLAAPFSVSYVQLKSSHREAEWYIHKPHLAFAGQVPGIQGTVAKFPGDEPAYRDLRDEPRADACEIDHAGADHRGRCAGGTDDPQGT